MLEKSKAATFYNALVMVHLWFNICTIITIITIIIVITFTLHYNMFSIVIVYNF